jgi:iron(III) transport system ATP-binding protein
VETPAGTFAAPGVSDGPAAVLLRPQGFAADAGGREAAVVRARFLGDDVEVLLQFSGLDEPLLARLKLPHAPPRGQTLRVSVDPAHALVFAKP